MRNDIRAVAAMGGGLFVLTVAGLCALLLAGCASVQPQGGTIGLVQQANDVLAEKYGVSPDIMARVRKALGIVDARSLPRADRILPDGCTWTQDVLDASNRVVDVTLFHWSVPRVVVGTGYGSAVVTAGDVLPGAVSTNGADALEGLLQMLLAHPELLKPAN